MKSKRTIVFLSLITILVLGIAGYFVYLNKQLDYLLKNNTNPSATTIVKTTTTPTITKVPNQNGNTYSSENLGVEFDYATYLDNEKTIKTLVFDEGNKIYLYNSVVKEPSQGQSVEVFNKDTKDSLDAAITKRFLSGISKDDCFVVTKSDMSNPNIIQATISYPWTNKDEPKFLSGEKCPENYKETNGLSYFEMDTNHPTYFIYLSIGQSPGPSSSDLPNSEEWFKSIRFTK